MNGTHNDQPESRESATEALRSIFVEAEGIEDTTVRPLRFKIPRSWPEDVPRPGAPDAPRQEPPAKP